MPQQLFLLVFTLVSCMQLTASQVLGIEEQRSWPAFPLDMAWFEAVNGSIPARWKAAWEASEVSSFPYSVSVAVAGLMELKAQLGDPSGMTADWSIGAHPCDFAYVSALHCPLQQQV